MSFLENVKNDQKQQAERGGPPPQPQASSLPPPRGHPPPRGNWEDGQPSYGGRPPLPHPPNTWHRGPPGGEAQWEAAEHWAPNPRPRNFPGGARPPPPPMHRGYEANGALRPPRAPRYDANKSNGPPPRWPVEQRPPEVVRPPQPMVVDAAPRREPQAPPPPPVVVSRPEPPVVEPTPDLPALQKRESLDADERPSKLSRQDSAPEEDEDVRHERVHRDKIRAIQNEGYEAYQNKDYVSARDKFDLALATHQAHFDDPMPSGKTPSSRVHADRDSVKCKLLKYLSRTLEKLEDDDNARVKREEA